MGNSGGLKEICVSYLTSGEVLEDGRLANVVPLFRRGSKDKPLIYRPVSQTSVVEKLLEGNLRDSIHQYLDRLGLIRGS